MTDSSISIYIFGTTAGLEVKKIVAYPDIEVLFENKWVEPRLDYINLVGNSPFYVIERRIISNQMSTWIGGYWPALEIGTSRPGGHAGAGLLLTGCSVDSGLALRVVNSLYTDMAARVMVKEGFTKRISNLELSKPLDLDGLLSSKKDIASTEPPYKSPITVQVANNSDLIDALQWAQSSGCSMFFPSIILGYSANFASVRDLDKNPNHYKNYSSILEATSKILSKDLNAAETENTTLKVEYSDLKKKVEVFKNDNAKLSSLNESLNQAISNNELVTQAKQKKQEGQETKANGYIEITWIHIAITAALIIAIFICVLIWQQRKAMEGASAPPPLPPKQVEAPPTPYEALPSTETETQPNPPSSCLNSKDSITVHYDSKLGNKKSAVRDDIVKKLGIVCKEITTEECQPTLDQIIRFEKDDPNDKAISVPLVCLLKAVDQGIYDLSITKSKITPKNN